MAVSAIHTGWGYRGSGGFANSSDISQYYNGTEVARMAAGGITVLDSMKLYWGTGSDASIRHDGTSLVLTFDQTTDEFVINETGADTDFRVEGDTNVTMIWIDAASNTLSIGTTAQEPENRLTIGGNFTSANTGAPTSALMTRDTVTMAVGQNGFGGRFAADFGEAGSGTHTLIAQVGVFAPTVVGGSAAVTNAVTLYVDGEPGATVTGDNYAFWVDGGLSRLDGALEVSDGHGSDGEQLTSGGTDAVLDWAAAGSLPEFKNVGAVLEPSEALASMLSVDTRRFTYRKTTPDGAHAVNTGDLTTEYAGVMGDAAPWAMHHHGKIFSPVSAFGYTRAAIEALHDRIQQLENDQNGAS